MRHDAVSEPEPRLPFITRIAPTPSGYLHAGNAVNFLLVRWLADAVGAKVVLRIDDMDADRYRRTYVDDIFATLGWLGISWDAGPATTSEFESAYSLRSRSTAYADVARQLHASGLAYACRCSRTVAGARGCAGACRDQDYPLECGRSALRLRIPRGTLIDLDGTSIDLAEVLGDPVIWRRDNQVSYHLASVIEDDQHQVTHVVRGQDLLHSSALHRYLATIIGAESFGRARILHHRLITDSLGRKLSKSQGSSGPMDRSDADLDRIVQLARELAPAIGIAPPGHTATSRVD